MILKGDWLKPGENTSFERELFLTYIKGVVDTLKQYRDGNINADTTLIECRNILSEIKHPEFPLFALRNFKDLFSFVLFQLPKIASRSPETLPTPESFINLESNNVVTHNWVEKRKYPRISKSFLIRFCPNQCDNKTLMLSGWDMVAVNDLSAMGVNFNYNKGFGVGAILKIKLDISRSTQTINCTGKVVRIRRNSNHPTYSMSIEFTDIDKGGVEVIKKTTEGMAP
ncbi:MAG: PilZ domain-containing protein [Planctomycetes bacterium]|nr:PilZ domain-containing protein [Planctomycetota bacterium]